MSYFLIVRPFFSIPIKENLLPEQRFVICLAIFSLCAAQFSGHIGTNDTAFYSCALLSSMDFSHCDEDVDYSGLVDLYKPPMPDLGEVVRSMESVLMNYEKVIRNINLSPIDIELTARRYIGFSKEVLESRGSLLRER